MTRINNTGRLLIGLKKSELFKKLAKNKTELGILTLTIAICIVMSLRNAILIPTFHLDGAFQTAAGLNLFYEFTLTT